LIRLKRQSQKEVFIMQVAAALVYTPAAIGVACLLLHRNILLCKFLERSPFPIVTDNIHNNGNQRLSVISGASE
jgi:hypothetical protein